MNLTKAELNKILVDERKKSRTKAQQSAFMKKTLSIYNGQKKRAKEAGATLPFSVQDLRIFFEKGLQTPCPLSGQKLTLTTATSDHSQPVARGGGWGLDNQEVIAASTNYQKGTLPREKFVKLLHFLREEFTPEEREETLRRLTIGGKHNFR